MDDDRIIRRTAGLLGLKRGYLRHITRDGRGGCYRCIALLLPAETSDIARRFTEALNQAIRADAAACGTPYLDLWEARHHRFSHEASLWEKVLARCVPHYVDKKYAVQPRDIAFCVTPGEHEMLEGQLKDGIAVVMVTSCRSDNQPWTKGAHDDDRTEALITLMEREEDELRSIIRHAAPSHHLLPVARLPVKPVSTVPVRAAQHRFIFNPVFAETAPASITMKV